MSPPLARSIPDVCKFLVGRFITSTQSEEVDGRISNFSAYPQPLDPIGDVVPLEDIHIIGDKPNVEHVGELLLLEAGKKLVPRLGISLGGETS